MFGEEKVGVPPEREPFQSIKTELLWENFALHVLTLIVLHLQIASFEITTQQHKIITLSLTSLVG